MNTAFPSHQALEEAAEWYALLRDGQASTLEQQRWQAWLTANEQHRFAWQFVEEISGRFEPLIQTANPRHTADQLNHANYRFKQRRRLLTGLASLAGLGIVSAVSWQQQWMPTTVLALTADYQTTIGQQQQLTLADGTQLWLNSASAINVAYNHFQRKIELVEGELFIVTAAHDQRPFVVQTRYGQLRPLGTRFNVLQTEDGIELAVYEGAVEIRTDQSKQIQRIETSQQARFNQHHINPSQPANLAREAWTSGILLAEDRRLSEVVKELGRYRRGYINVADEIADLEVYGSFPLHNTDQVITMLSQVLPIEVVHILPWWINIKPKSDLNSAS